MFIDNISKSTRKKYGKSVDLIPESKAKKTTEKVWRSLSRKYNKKKYGKSLLILFQKAQ